ncbi:16S rRNA (cytosine(1402)-N(4))-methyltransferase RsmH [Deferribacteraceae bacterium V6Fe1]|nr:16S rRNA (cytosine(1402)-N(4))-methyltransferase RsmH [Deferribacteraceae bacterium V6Fe1]
MHKPVMSKELIEYLKPVKGGVYVDCTGGGGGHAKLVLEKIGESGKLIILDRDQDAIERLKEKFNLPNVMVVNENFSNISSVLSGLGIQAVDGLYADFGTSSFQLNDPQRGFSFLRSGPLDMRMDKNLEIDAYTVVNNYPEETIANILKKYGEEQFAKRIAGKIIQKRAIEKISTTKELADIIFDAVPKKFHKPGVHPATKSFQALRIFVNKELESIESLLKSLEKIIKKSGRVVFISFHSLEDRLVKDMLNYYAKDCICEIKTPICNCGKIKTFKILTKKPVTPSESEINDNKLSRSAKLRAAEKIV